MYTHFNFRFVILHLFLRMGPKGKFPLRRLGQLLKFSYSEKTTTFEKKISHHIWRYLVTSKKLGYFFFKCCGLLRISELYMNKCRGVWFGTFDDDASVFCNTKHKWRHLCNVSKYPYHLPLFTPTYTYNADYL